MFGNFKHTMECKVCKGKEQFETFPNKTQCACGGELEYIGFQPYIDPVLQGMLKQAKTADSKINKIEEIKVEEPKLEESKIEESKVEELKIEKDEINNIEQKIETFEKVNLTIDDIFNTNEKMTNAKMEPLMKEFIPKGEVEKLKLLKEYYPSTFEKATKYIGKKNQTKLEELMADCN